MRNIPATALAEINKQYGIESLIVIRIFWEADRYNDYSEKAFPEYGIEGRILSVSGIDDVVSVEGSGNSKSVEVVLSDHDGALKNIYDNKDLHKVRCQVLQWFDNIPLSQAFIIFDGSINTPISWKEGERTLSIAIMSLLENLEFGFSPDESHFGLVGNNVLGEAWPIAFGTNLKVRALAINEPPSILLAEGFSIVDEELWEEELADMSFQINEALFQAALAYASSAAATLIASYYLDGQEGPFVGNIPLITPVGTLIENPPDDYSTWTQYRNQAQDYYIQFSAYMAEYRNLTQELSLKQEEFELQKDLAKRNVHIISSNVPRGVPLIVEMGGTRWNVAVNGSMMFLVSEITPEDQAKASFAIFSDNTSRRQWQGRPGREKFRWVAGGTRLKVLNYPLKYVISLGGVTSLNIWGRQQGMYVSIPTQYYTIASTPFRRSDGIIVNATTLTLLQPLTTILNRYGEQVWESDDIFVDVRSDIPGKMVDIIVYAIENFSNITYDPVSFGLARLYTDHVPMNHVVRDRRDTLQYIKEIAFQGKCALWINDNIAYIRYLPVEPAPVDTIVTADILEDTLEIFSTDTEEVITRLTALWKFTEDQPTANKIHFRYNIQKYGLQDLEYNFFAFNDATSVGWSARYWIIRKGTVFKKIRFKTDLIKLNLETWDAVTVNIPFVANEPVTGIIESAVYDNAQKEIEFVIWLPVCLGTMHKCPFGYPTSEIFLFGDPADPGIFTGNPLQNLEDLTGFMLPTRDYYINVGYGAIPPMRVIPYDIEEAPVDLEVITALLEVPVDPGLPLGIETKNNYDKYEVQPVQSIELQDDSIGSASFGRIVQKKDGSVYKVKLIGSEVTINAEQLLIGSESPDIPVDTPVLVVKVKGVYYMQTPVWL